jgi:integrase
MEIEKMAAIRKREGKKGTTYTVTIRKTGFPSETKSFPTISKAKQWATSVEAKMDDGKWDTGTSEANKHTLRELIDFYLEVEGEATARVSCLNWWKDEIGRLKLSAVTPSVLNKCKIKLGQSSACNRTNSRGPATINRHLAYLSVVFSQGVREYQWCAENPVLKVKKLKEPKGRIRFLSDDERTALLTECKKNPQLYELVVLALTTGARAGEMLNLQWSDIDFQRGTATLRNTKNGETRLIAVSGHAMDLLKPRRGIGFVFPSNTGKATYEYSKPFKKAVEAAEIEDFRFHDLRHTAASYLAQAGKSLLEIMETLGHKSVAMASRYAHLTTKTVEDSSTYLNSKMFDS